MLKDNDPVHHPSHYTQGKIEVIAAIEDWGLGYHRGNAVKYIARAGKKDKSKELEDLRKAAWYIEREIFKMENAREEKESNEKSNPQLTGFGDAHLNRVAR